MDGGRGGRAIRDEPDDGAHGIIVLVGRDQSGDDSRFSRRREHEDVDEDSGCGQIRALNRRGR